MQCSTSSETKRARTSPQNRNSWQIHIENTQKVHLAQERLEAQRLQAGKILGREVMHTCPALVLAPSICFQIQLKQSWRDAYLKLLTRLFQQLSTVSMGSFSAEPDGCFRAS